MTLFSHKVNKMATFVKKRLSYLLMNITSSFTGRVCFPKNQKILFHCSSLLYVQGQELKMPSLSPTMTEGKIVRWLKKEGDIILAGDILCDIETDKAVVSMEVEEDGILAKILVSENTSIKVGSLIGLTVSEGEDWKNVNVPSEAKDTMLNPLYTSSSALSSEPIIIEPSATPVQMPSLFPTMKAGKILKWLKKEGDKIAVGDVLCDIQTNEAVMSLKAEEDGILAKIIVPADSRDIKIGSIIAVVIPEGVDWKNIGEASHKPLTVTKDFEQSIYVSSGSNGVRGKSFGPAVKVLLASYQLEPGLIKPTGRHNRLLKEDVLKYIIDHNLERKPPKLVLAPKQTKSASVKVESVSANKTKIALTGVSKHKDIKLSKIKQITAKKLLESKRDIPYSYSVAKCHIDNLLKVKKSFSIGGIKVTLNDLLTKATALALQIYPKANALCIGNEIKLSERVDICVAVFTDMGLFTPVVRSTNLKSVSVISQEIRELSTKAESGQLKPEEIQGGTFMISNLGMYGVTHFKAIINPPHCGILAVGGINETLKSDFAIQKQIILSLSYDRRALQEHQAAKFMETLKYIIENPRLITTDTNFFVEQEL